MNQIHLGINIRLQQIRNISEYILKLQLHQHSLLTRKVLSQHNLLAQVFFSVSSESSSTSHHLHLQFIFIFSHLSYGSRSSLNMDHHWLSSLDLDHHLIWIITAGSSSLNLDHHWASSQVLSLDSSCHRNLYRARPFSYRMYHLRASPFHAR